MSTKEQITTAIDTKIRNKTPLVVKVEHADVEQLIADEFFPDSVKIEWNGSSAVDPIADIVCNNSALSLQKTQFLIYFTKHGNRVFYRGVIKNFENVISIGNMVLATFETSTYNPIAAHSSCSNLIPVNAISPSILQNCFILMKDDEVKLVGSIPFGISIYQFEGSYKVAN